MKTSRCSGESSCHSVSSGRMPDPTVKRPTATPIPITSWWGRMRREVRTSCSGASVAMADRSYPPSLVGAENGRSIRLRSAERLGVELANPSGQCCHELAGHARHLVEHAGELAGAEDEHVGVGLRDDGGRARAVVEQRELTDAIAGPERGHLAVAPLHRRAARHEDVALPAGVTLLDEHPAGGDAELVRRLRDLLELALRARREQRDRGEVIEVRVLLCHAAGAYVAPAARARLTPRPRGRRCRASRSTPSGDRRAARGARGRRTDRGGWHRPRRARRVAPAWPP